MIKVLQGYNEGKEIEVCDGKDSWIMCTDPSWDFSYHNYRIKPEPTREEITKKWVKDNKIEVGSKVKVVRKVEYGEYGNGMNWVEQMDEYIGKIFTITEITDDLVNFSGITLDGRHNFPIEALEPYKEEYEPFTWEDRDMFREKWVRSKGGHKKEFMVNSISGGHVGSVTYQEAFEVYEFIDGTPFGKIKK